MLNVIALFALLSLPATDTCSVRIGLFSLFRPEAVYVRIASGKSARLDSTISMSRAIAPGDSIRIHLSGAQLNVVLADSYGRVKHSAITRAARITTQDRTTLQLTLPGKMKREVRGDLLIAPQEARARGALKIILTTELESAAASVVAAEIGGERRPEAIKALAIVVRTFMLSQEDRHQEEGFDFCDTTHCQVYRGEADLSIEAVSPSVANAVMATVGQYLTFNGRKVKCYYTAVCGGLTSTPEMVWGGAAGSGYTYARVACHWCSASRYFQWERSADAQAVLGALSSADLRLSQAAEIIIEREEAGDLVRSVKIRDRKAQVTMSTDEFRRLLGRRLGWNTVLSPTFQIERRGDRFVFRGRGFGSQVGLCLAGAVRQAAAGRSSREILSFYYPETEIRNLSESVKGEKKEQRSTPMIGEGSR